MIHILKAEEGEQTRNSILWTLTIYDDKTEEIIERTLFQYVEEEE